MYIKILLATPRIMVHDPSGQRSRGKFLTKQMFVLVHMQLCNHVDTRDLRWTGQPVRIAGTTFAGRVREPALLYMLGVGLTCCRAGRPQVEKFFAQVTEC